MRNIIAICIAFLSVVSTAQNKNKSVKDTIPMGWNSKGKISFLFNQAAFSNWAAGGENSIAGTLGINYDLNYHQKNWDWDNRIVVAYGLTKTQNSEFIRKTDDRFELNSVIGKKGKNNWFYSGFLNFRTQLSKGYRFDTAEDGTEIRTEHTNAFSPAYATFGPGFLWKKSNDFNINLAPLTSKVTIVDRAFTLPNQTYFGVAEGDSFRYELGIYASGYYKFTVLENIVMEQILNLYSNYLEKPKNVDVDYMLNIVMTVNKYFSATINFQTIYDDNAFQGFQTREVLGLGVNYVF